MPAIEIRPAIINDLPLLSAIDHSYETMHTWQMDRSLDENQVVVNFREIRLPRKVRVDYPRPLDFFSAEGFSQSVVLVALLNSIPVGYLRMKEELEPRTAWIKDVAVRADVRRQGVASVLVLSAQDWAVQRGLKRVILEMQSKNVAAIRLAAKLGYEFCGYNDHYYATQDIALFFGCYLR
ncbi:MAG: GNAT family N-acetyltransferase [Anaerolineae bacterium]|nr:GNAT family N-acetyltransferase [Anaerolineae bacterium]